MSNADKKAAKNQADAKVEAPKRERKVLTDEERIAKLEADLKAAREKAEAKNKKAIDALLEKRGNLAAKKVELNEKIARIDEDLVAAGFTPEAIDVEAEAEASDEKLRAV